MVEEEQVRMENTDENCKQNENQAECLICSINFSQANDEKEEKRSLKIGTTEECRDLANQLEVVFLLRKVLNIPEDICCKFLEDYGNPCTWLQCCKSCSVLVEETRNVFNQIIILEDQYDQYRRRLKTKVLNSGDSKIYLDSKGAGVNETVRFYVSQEFPTSLKEIVVKTEKPYSEEIDSNNEDCFMMQIYNSDSDEFAEDQDLSGSTVKGCKISKSKRREQKRRIFRINKKVKKEKLVSSVAKLIQDDENELLPKTNKAKAVIRRNYVRVRQATRYSCSTCGKKFNLLTTLKCHEKIHSGESSNECEYCGKTFARPDSLSLHLKTHTGEKLFTCDFCSKSFVQVSDLKTHLNSHTGERPYSCEICGRRFRSSSNKSKHKRTHMEIKRFPCTICKKTFSKTQTLTSHMKTHDGEVPYACEVCGKVFSLSSKFKSHMKSHTGGKDYTCEFCGKRFNSSGNKKIHQKIHTGDKQHSCEICGKSFIQLNNLKVHILTHSVEKPFFCDFCGKGFRKNSYFKEHIKSHNGETPFTCHKCGKGFRHAHHLLRHERFHTGEKPFPCGKCEKAFAQSSDLRRHEKTHLNGNNNLT